MVKTKAKAKPFENAAIRLTTDEEIPWNEIFDKDELVFSLCAHEPSKEGVLHSHSAVTLAYPMARNTIISRVQKRFPALKGNGKISVKQWDGYDKYLYYCCKPIGGLDKMSEKRVYTFGSRLGLLKPEEYMAKFVETQQKIKAKQKAKKEIQPCVPWCVEQLRSKYEGEDHNVLYEDVVRTMYRYYSEHREGWVEGNDFTVLRYARQIRFELSHKTEAFKGYWFLHMMEQLNR